MKINLCENDWKFKGFWQYDPIKTKSMETGIELQGIMEWADATVPGGVQYDLLRHGMIDDPLYGKNCLKAEWVENRWWMYRTSFAMPENAEGRKAELVFEGLDYEADIHLNHQYLCSHKGMYEPCVVDVTGLLQEENILVILFRGAPQEMGQIGFTSLTSTQKSRFNYRWDFSARMVNIGIWRDILLHVYDEAELNGTFVQTTLRGQTGEVRVSGTIKPGCEAAQGKEYEARLTLLDPAGKPVASATAAHLRAGESIVLKAEVQNPQLWQTNEGGGLREQPLYTCVVTLVDGGKVVYEYSRKAGIRSIGYAHNDGRPDALPYTFVVNGKKTYIKGVNMTPLDHMYGNVTREQYHHMVLAMANANINMARIWGGGLIEREEFYEECTRYGILVWQEFIQSSSGIDNKPSEDPAFMELLRRNARAALLEKRSHTCLAVWSGGNELMELDGTPCGYDNKNIAMLKALVEEYDPGRLFLPTSASGPNEFIVDEPGQNHDVHGSWQYLGNPKHYEVYGQCDSLFHSEFGNDGTTCVKSMLKFLPPESLRPTRMSDDRNWWYHGAWWGTYNRDVELYGPQEELRAFTQNSQLMQAEGLGFIIEANRRRKFQNSGSIVWQLNEPWPNASCTNSLDYYGEAKLAYYTLQQVFAPLHLSLGYSRLDYAAGSEFAAPVFVNNSGAAREVSVTALVRDKKGEVLYRQSFAVNAAENSATEAGTLAFTVPETDCFFVTLLAEGCGENSYFFGTAAEQPLSPLTQLNAQVSIELLDNDAWESGKKQRVRLKNNGSEVALGVIVRGETDEWWAFADAGNLTLFPGEQAEATVMLLPKQAGSFLAAENYKGGEPTLCIEYQGKKD